jgi:hypothetical protein
VDLKRLASLLDAVADPTQEVVYGGDIYRSLGFTQPGEILVPGEFGPYDDGYDCVGLGICLFVAGVTSAASIGHTAGSLLEATEEYMGRSWFRIRGRPNTGTIQGSAPLYADAGSMSGPSGVAVCDVVQGGGRVILVTYDISEYLRHIVPS